MAKNKIAMLILLAMIPHASATYDHWDPTHKRDPAKWSANLWDSVKVHKSFWGGWQDPDLKLKRDCAWFETERICNIHGGWDCKWDGQSCVNKEAFSDVDNFCYSTPTGYKLNEQQCSMLPYWREQAKIPSSKAVGKCKEVDMKIVCAAEDRCEAGNEDAVSKTYAQKVHTYDCEKDCSGIADEGIRYELTHRCCNKCQEIAATNGHIIVVCKGCNNYVGKPLKTSHLVTCNWKNPLARVREICQQQGKCQSGAATVTNHNHAMQCKIVPCDPMCLHDRQMYASCCQTCLENMCAKDALGKFTNYGTTKVNQMCRGCIPPTTTVTTTTPCKPSCCPATPLQAAVAPSTSIIIKDTPPAPDDSFWLKVGLASVGTFLLGTCITALVCGLCSGSKKRSTRTYEKTKGIEEISSEEEEEEEE